MPKKITIKKGDTLSQIAEREGTTVDVIMKSNEGNKAVKSRDLIIEGGSLNLPDAPGPVEPQEPVNRALELVGADSRDDVAVSTSDSIREEERKKKEEKEEDDLDRKIELSRKTEEEEIKRLGGQVKPEGERPEAPDLEEAFTGFISEKDAAGFTIEDYQSKITDLESEKGDLFAEFRTLKRELPKGVAQRFATGTLSERGQEIQDEIDFLDRRINTYNTHIANRNNIINAQMGFKQQDYATASAEYDKQFTQNLQLYNTVQDKIGVDKELEEAARDNARVNLQIVQKQIEEGAIQYNDLDDDKKNLIRDLEIQSGYPQGFTKFITANVDGDIVTTSSRTDAQGRTYYDVLTRGADGSLKVTSIFRGTEDVKPKEGIVAEFLQRQEIPQEVANKDGSIRKSVRNKLVDAGFSLQVVQGLWDNIIAGNEFDVIRKGIQDQGGDPAILDAFVVILQE